MSWRTTAYEAVRPLLFAADPEAVHHAALRALSVAAYGSLGRGLYEVAFTDLYRRMGVPAAVIRRHHPQLRRMIGHLDGRIYYAIDNWYVLHGMMRCFRPLFPTWEQALGLA